MPKPMRDSNMELLRILAVMGVIMLHFNGIYGKALEYVVKSSATEYALRYLECLAIPAVNIFVLLTGYYLCTSYRREVIKPICLLVQVMFFREVLYLVSVMQSDARAFSLKTAMGVLVPSNYYVILYIALYFISPYINLAIDRLTDRQWKTFLGIALSLFSVFPTAVDLLQEMTGSEYRGLNPVGRLGDQGGYTIVQFVLMYVVGAYLRKRKAQWSWLSISAMLAGCSIGLLIWSKVLPQTAWMYCNPLVILEAVCIFQLFEKIYIESKWLNRASKAVFTCFLVHEVFVQMLPVKQMVNAELWILLPLIAAILLGIFAASVVIHLIYHYLEKYIVKNILKIFHKVVLDAEPSKEGEICKS